MQDERCEPDWEQDVVQRLRLRQRPALGELASRFGIQLKKIAYIQLGDLDAAEDVAQETLIAAWDAAKRSGENTQLRPWLFGILFNQCRKYRRSLWRRWRRERRAAQRGGEREDHDSQQDEQLTVLRKALMQLDERQRAVITLRYEQGLSIDETAEALMLPAGTVKSRTHAAIERLRKTMRFQIDEQR